MKTFIECNFSSFFFYSLISRFMLRLRITFYKVSLFLLSTLWFISGYFSENFTFTWSNLSMNFNCYKSYGAFCWYYFKNTTSSFLYFWLLFICFTNKLLREHIFCLVRGILKLVLCLLLFLSTFFLRSWRSPSYSFLKLSLFNVPIS